MHTWSNGPITVGFITLILPCFYLLVEARQPYKMACILSLLQTTKSAYWSKSWSFRGDIIQWNFLGQWCSVCRWFGATNPSAHTEDRDGGSSRNVGNPSHHDAAVCPRSYLWLHNKCTSDNEQCLLNLHQTTNNAYWIYLRQRTMLIEFTSDNEQCILNLPQTTNNAYWMYLRQRTMHIKFTSDNEEYPV